MRHHIRVFDLLIATVGVVVTFVWAAGVPSSGSSAAFSATDGWWVYASVIGFGAGGLVHTPAHELGHLLAAAALRLRIVGLRVWWFRLGRVDVDMPGTSGHVQVETAGGVPSMPLRMSLFALAGPAANLMVSMVSIVVALDASAATGLRTVAVGVAVRGLHDAILSLVPRRIDGVTDTDGRVALNWLLRPPVARTPASYAKAVIARPSSDASTDRRTTLVAAIEDDHPDVAVAAMRELLRRRSRWDDGWQDYEVMAGFAAREDIAADVRASASGLYALSLATACLDSRERDAGMVVRIERLADLALAADPDSLQARAGTAMVRVIQDRPDEARAFLLDVTPDATPLARARAFAVRGIAELALGSSDLAHESARLARRDALDDSVVRLLHARLEAETPPSRSTSS